MPSPALLALCLAASLGLAACETMQGAGRDIQKAGQAVEQTSQQVQKQM